jgi:hypothetical protein
LLNIAQNEELIDMGLNFEEPFWELEGKTDLTSFFHALNEILPENSTLYFEFIGNPPSGSLLDFIETNSISEKTAKWKESKYFHVPATMQNLSLLTEISRNVADSERHINIHISCNNEVILQWHYACLNFIYLSGELPEDRARVFADKLHMRIFKWQNVSEQIAARENFKKDILYKYLNKYPLLTQGFMIVAGLALLILLVSPVEFLDTLPDRYPILYPFALTILFGLFIYIEFKRTNKARDDSGYGLFFLILSFVFALGRLIWNIINEFQQ